jgi:hypothetical protein
VPPGYESGQADITYADALDPEQQLAYGIGPGCVDNVTGAFAIPPVREREVVEAFDTGNGERALYSICNDDFSPALTSIANRILDEIPPPCVPACIADADPIQQGLQVQCTVTQRTFDSVGSPTDIEVPLCEGDALPAAADVCWIPRTGDGLSAFCAELGWNLELGIVRREGVPAPSDTEISVDCALSENDAVDCPNLP